MNGNLSFYECRFSDRDTMCTIKPYLMQKNLFELLYSLVAGMQKLESRALAPEPLVKFLVNIFSITFHLFPSFRIFCHFWIDFIKTGLILLFPKFSGPKRWYIQSENIPE